MKSWKRPTLATNKINKRSDCKKLVCRKVKGNKEQKIQGENRIYVRATGTYSSCFVNRILNVHLRTIQNLLCFIAVLFWARKAERRNRFEFSTFFFSTRFFRCQLLMLWLCRCVCVFSTISHNFAVRLGRFTCRKTLICWIVRSDWAAALHIIEAIIAWESVTWKIIIIQIVKFRIAVAIVSMASVSSTAII